MAELHVQRKRTSHMWLWILLILLLLAGGVYYYMHSVDPAAYPLPAKSASLNTTQEPDFNNIKYYKL